MTITKQHLERLEAARPKLNAELHYRIDGPVEAAVHSTAEAERIGRLNQGHRVMTAADQRFQHEMSMKVREGLPRSQFQETAKARDKAAELRAARKEADAEEDQGIEL